MSAHIGDDAELYALGVLEADEREAIDAHLESCAECSQRVGRSERIVVALEALAAEESPNAKRLASVRMAWLAVAAAVALAIGLGGTLAGEHAYVASVVASDGAVVEVLVNSHFLHKPFVANRSGAPLAKVLYARDGAWLYVVVDAARNDWLVAGDASGRELKFGRLQARGTSSVLFVRPPHPVDTLRLIDADGVVAERVEALSATRLRFLTPLPSAAP